MISVTIAKYSKKIIKSRYPWFIRQLYCEQSWTSPGGNTPQGTNYTAACLPSRKVRRTRHAGHCWRSRDELISDVLLWTPTYGRAKAGRATRTYIQQLCEDTGCSPEDLPEAMNDREKWREGQGYPCWRHHMMMMFLLKEATCILTGDIVSIKRFLLVLTKFILVWFLTSCWVFNENWVDNP